MTQLVLMRHGQSIWNREGRFTGWSDSALSPQGEQESERAGRLLRQTGHTFDLCFTSELQRATDTVHIVLTAMGLAQLPVQQSWHLNERHFGAMEGYNRLGAVRKFGLWGRYSSASCNSPHHRHPSIPVMHAPRGTSRVIQTSAKKICRLRRACSRPCCACSLTGRKPSCPRSGAESGGY